MKYTICASFPRADERGSGARPHVDDMITVVKTRFELAVDQGPSQSIDGTAKICFATEDPAEVLALMQVLKDRSIDGYWYDSNPNRQRGDVCHFGDTERWDLPQKK